MRKLSNTFLLVGGIISIVLAACLLLSAIIMFIGATPACGDLLAKLVDKIPNKGDASTEDIVKAIQLAFVVSGVFCIFMGALAIPSIVVSFKARQNPTANLLICNIVFGLLCGSEFNAAGGILGLIRNKREERNKNRVVDAQ